MSGETIDEQIRDRLNDLHSVDSDVRNGVISALTRIDRATAITALTKLINCQETELRCDAAEALIRLDRNAGVDLLCPLLLDADSLVRWGVCGLLHDFGDKRAVSWLTRALSDDSEADVRLLAATALGRIGTHEDLPNLRKAAERDLGADYDGHRVRDAAAEAIVQILARG